MSIDKIREQLAEKIAENLAWSDKLNNTQPGHYGLEDWEVDISPNDIWVEIQERTFNFKNAKFNFELLMGDSNEENGTKMSFSKKAKGEGIFKFTANSSNIEIEDIDTEFDLDLFA